LTRPATPAPVGWPCDVWNKTRREKKRWMKEEMKKENAWYR
jgi:hypothetical protein